MTTSETIRNALYYGAIKPNNTAAEVAKILLVSNRTLVRHLQQEGTTFNTVITDYRLNTAKHMIRGTKKPLHEIAMEVGLKYRRSLDRIFMQHTGVTAAQYRVIGVQV